MPPTPGVRLGTELLCPTSFPVPWEAKRVSNESPGREEGSGGLEALTILLPYPRLCSRAVSHSVPPPRCPSPPPAHSGSPSTCSDCIRAGPISFLCSELLELSQPEKAGQTTQCRLGSHTQTKETLPGGAGVCPVQNTAQTHCTHVSDCMCDDMCDVSASSLALRGGPRRAQGGA